MEFIAISILVAFAPRYCKYSFALVPYAIKPSALLTRYFLKDFLKKDKWVNDYPIPDYIQCLFMENT